MECTLSTLFVSEEDDGKIPSENEHHPAQRCPFIPNLVDFGQQMSTVMATSEADVGSCEENFNHFPKTTR